MKKVILTLLAIGIGCGISAGVLIVSWKRYVPTAIVQSDVQTTSSDLKTITQDWFDDFFKQYKGIFVPFSYRLQDTKIKQITVLNPTERYVQLDYLIKPASANASLLAYYGALPQEKGWYMAQVVLQWDRQNDRYVVSNKMSPVQYQIMSDPTLREPTTTHYAMPDKKETYVFDKQQLYVTYDKGANLIKVPVPYEDIAGTNNGTYNELLPNRGYVVSKAFTGFVCYDDVGSYLYYSKDMGKTWKKSRIVGVPYRSETIHMTKTETSCYITLAVDRSLGHEYYGTFKSSDLKNWKQLSGQYFDKENVSFVADGVAYINGGHDENGDPIMYLTQDDGASFTTLHIPPHKVKLEGLKTTIEPFVDMEYAYKKDDKTYLVIGQGSDGDYAKNKKLMKGLYVSENGIDFTFEKEIDETPTLAG